MRVGQNPGKSDSQLEQSKYHRIIIPVYIPHFEDYFKDSETILKLCLNSLLNSVHQGCAISIINNACTPKITSYLRELKDSGKIDRLIDAHENRGKIDPLISEMRSSYEPLITVSDADVLFKPNWIIEVEKTLIALPKCGMLGHLPDPKKYKGFNATTLLHTLWNTKHEEVDFKSELDRFADSIGEPKSEYVQGQLKVYTKNGVETVVGAHHFSVTVKRDYLSKVPQNPSLKKITGNSESHYIDRPMDQYGFLRLSTRYPVVYHMGNVFENWMKEEFEKFNESVQTVTPLNSVFKSEKSFFSYIPYKFRTVLETLFFRTFLYKLIVKHIY